MLPLCQTDSAVVFDGNWEDIISEAETAGRLAAWELVHRCNTYELARSGRGEVDVGPPGSPVAAWLLCTRRASSCNSRMARVDIDLAGTGIRPATSLPLRQAYAAAYCSVLTEEVGAVADKRVALITAPSAEVPGPVPERVCRTE